MLTSCLQLTQKKKSVFIKYTAENITDKYFSRITKSKELQYIINIKYANTTNLKDSETILTGSVLRKFTKNSTMFLITLC